jgi:uncharacterized phiE125 gp8 family phage protein
MRRSDVLKTSPNALALSLADAKAHLNITFSTDDDLITAYIGAATQYCEQYCVRKLITQTWYLYLDQWPSNTYLHMPFGDLQSVTSIKYYDTDDTEATFSNTKYTVDIASVPGRVVLKNNETWPTESLRPDNPIIIEYVTGYGDAQANITDVGIVHALKMMVAHFYENREPLYISTNSNTVSPLPKTVDTLLYPYRIWRWIV